MIKIIKQGQLRKFYVTCPECGCEFEYDKEDVSTICSGLYAFSYVVCPCCGEQVNHPTDEPIGCECEEDEKK